MKEQTAKIIKHSSKWAFSGCSTGRSLCWSSERLVKIPSICIEWDLSDWGGQIIFFNNLLNCRWRMVQPQFWLDVAKVPYQSYLFCFLILLVHNNDNVTGVMACNSKCIHQTTRTITIHQSTQKPQCLSASWPNFDHSPSIVSSKARRGESV